MSKEIELKISDVVTLKAGDVLIAPKEEGKEDDVTALLFIVRIEEENERLHFIKCKGEPKVGDDGFKDYAWSYRRDHLAKFVAYGIRKGSIEEVRRDFPGALDHIRTIMNGFTDLFE